MTNSTEREDAVTQASTGEVNPDLVNGGTTGSRQVPQSLRRKAIAKHMRSSLGASAQLTCGVKVSLDRAMAVRTKFAPEAGEKTGIQLSPLTFVARATCLALADMPLFNSTFDVEAEARIEYGAVNLGIAVDTSEGLVVANVKQAELLRTVGLARAIATIASKVRARKTRIEDITGGTFTISNTGSRGSAFDTPILNWPEVGILAIPVVRREPFWEHDVHGGRFVARWQTTLCLTYDHQVADGADAARFCTLVGKYLDTWDFGKEVGEELATFVPNGHSD